MSIEPVAWMNDDFEFFTNKDRAYPFGKCKPLYPQSAIDELQRQLAESKENERLLHQACADYEQEVPDLQRQLAEKEQPVDKVCVEDDGCPTEIAVLQRQWRELQRQLADTEKLCKWLPDSETMAELKRQAADSSLAAKSVYIAALERQLAEREAVIVQLREALEAMVASARGMNCGLRIADEALAIPTDHTALDEAIKPRDETQDLSDF